MGARYRSRRNRYTLRVRGWFGDDKSFLFQPLDMELYRLADKKSQFFATAVGGQLNPSSDATDARWVPFSEVRNYDVTKTVIARLEENGLI